MNYGIELFKGVDFSDQDNTFIELQSDLDVYLSHLRVLVTTTNNIVRLAPTITITVNVAGFETGGYNENLLFVNYCHITSPTGRADWYYFVDSSVFVSRNAVRLTLSIDYLNTFFWSTKFFQCHIVRRFKDRWKFHVSKYYPVFDDASEGFDITKTLDPSSVKTIKDRSYSYDSSASWILAVATKTYEKSQTAVVRYYPIIDAGSSIEVNASHFSGTVFADTPLSVNPTTIDNITSGNAFSETIDSKSLTIKGIRCYLLPYSPPAVGEPLGTADQQKYNQSSNNDNGWYWNGVKGSGTGDIQVATTLFFNSELTTLVADRRSSESEKLKSTRLIYQDDAFRLNTRFAMPYPQADTADERKKKMKELAFDVTKDDPKLGTSEFLGLKFEYLGASFTYAPEKMEDGTYAGIAIDYSVSPNSDSPVRFRVRPLDWENQLHYRYSDDDLGYIIPSSDLSYPMTSSEYNEYRLFGNKYDKTSTNLAYANIAAGVATAAGSAAVGFGVGGPAGAVIAGIGGAVFSAITSSIATWNSQQAKLQSEKTKSITATQSSVDFNMIQTGNRARLLTYEIPDYLKRSLTYYFHLFGYSTDEYGKPSDYIHSRFAFDFIKCDLVNYDKGSIESAFREGFENKLKDGVYCLHKLYSEDGSAYEFDFGKNNANRELSILNNLT